MEQLDATSNDTMNLKIAIIAIAMASLLVGYSITCVTASTCITENEEDPDGADLVILSSEEMQLSSGILQGQYGSLATIVGDVEDMPFRKAILFDQSWIVDNGMEKVNEVVAKQIREGRILAGTDSFLFTNEHSPIEMVGFAEGADIYSVYYDSVNDRYVCCSIDAGSLEKSAKRFNEWVQDAEPAPNVERVNAIDNALASSSNYAQWGTELVCESYKYYEGYGWMNINTSYFPLNEDNPDYNYYYTKYDVQSVPDSGRYTSEINVYTQLYNGFKILDYGPTTSTGSTTVGVNLSVSTDGVVSAGVSWSYSVGDVVVNDRTNYGTKEFHVKHDVNETKPVGSNTYTVKPGKVVRVDCNDFTMTGNYVGVDEYEIVFGKEVKSGLFGTSTKWEYKSFTQRVGVNCKSNPHTLTVIPNGADGYMHPEEDPFRDCNQPITTVVSDGGHVTMYPTDHMKIGHEFIGYSTNKNAKTAQYVPGDIITLHQDMTLYMVWVKV